MPDVFSPQQRSKIMSKVRSRGNLATELRLIQIFRTFRIHGWRRHAPLIGKPDFIFPDAKVAIFVDGCFWHSCPRHGELPVTNRKFWARKLIRNRDRDQLVAKELKSAGWRVLRIWQHELSEPNKVARRVGRAVFK
ncbi:MAG: very short patch repair endonuclease [Candidatus Binatia bacterium]